MESLDAEEIIHELMNPTTRFILKDEFEDVLPLENIILLLNNLQEEPVGTFIALTKYMTICKMAYRNVAATYTDLKEQMERRIAEIELNSQKADHPYKDMLPKGKVAIGVSKLIARNDAVVMRLNESLIELRTKKENIWAIYEVIEKTHTTALSIIENVENVRASGEVISREEVESQVDRFKNNMDV